MRAKYLLAIPALLLGLTIGFRECSEHKRYVSKYEQNFSEYKESARSRQKFVSEKAYKENHIKIVNSERNIEYKEKIEKKIEKEDFFIRFLDAKKSGDRKKLMELYLEVGNFPPALRIAKENFPEYVEQIVKECYESLIGKIHDSPEQLLRDSVVLYICSNEIDEEIKKNAYRAMIEAAKEVKDPTRLEMASIMLEVNNFPEEATHLRKIIEERCGKIEFTFMDNDESSSSLVVLEGPVRCK
jgi:hypothetical protein